MQNITIDDTNTTAIHYYPPLCAGTGWTQDQTSDAQGGSYTYCNGANFARATFKFTGVGVHFLCPRYITPDTMYVSLDNGPFEEISLRSTNGGAQASDVVWSAVDLPNAEHLLEMVPGAYNGSMGFVSVDGFIVTTSDEPIQSAPGDSVSSSSGSSNTPIAIGVGVALGVVLLMLIGVAVWMFMNKRKNNKILSSPAGLSTQPFLAPSPNVDPQTNMTQFAPYTDYRQSSVVPDPAMALYSGAAPGFNKPGQGTSAPGGATAFV